MVGKQMLTASLLGLERPREVWWFLLKNLFVGIACVCVVQESLVAEYLSLWNSERRNVSRNDYIENNVMFPTQLQAQFSAEKSSTQ